MITKRELRSAFLGGADYEEKVIMDLVDDVGRRDAFENWFAKRKRRKAPLVKSARHAGLKTQCR